MLQHDTDYDTHSLLDVAYRFSSGEVSSTLESRGCLNDLRAVNQVALRVSKDGHLPESGLEGTLNLGLVVCKYTDESLSGQGKR